MKTSTLLIGGAVLGGLLLFAMSSKGQEPSGGKLQGGKGKGAPYGLPESCVDENMTPEQMAMLADALYGPGALLEEGAKVFQSLGMPKAAQCLRDAKEHPRTEG